MITYVVTTSISKINSKSLFVPFHVAESEIVESESDIERVQHTKMLSHRTYQHIEHYFLSPFVINFELICFGFMTL